MWCPLVYICPQLINCRDILIKFNKPMSFGLGTNSVENVIVLCFRQPPRKDFFRKSRNNENKFHFSFSVQKYYFGTKNLPGD